MKNNNKKPLTIFWYLILSFSISGAVCVVFGRALIELYFFLFDGRFELTKYEIFHSLKGGFIGGLITGVGVWLMVKLKIY